MSANDTIEVVPSEATVSVSVIIPCLNEAMAIGSCVRSALDALTQGGWVGEVLVCDNGSTDDSMRVAHDAGAQVVTQPVRGYGAAIVRGVEHAQGEIIVIVDGDNTYDLSELSRFVEPLRVGYDLVLGTRRNGLIRPGAMRKRHRHLLEPFQAWLCRRFLSIRVSDVRCGLRSIRRDALSRLNLGATGMEFASEMVLEAARVGLSSVEVPVTFLPRVSEDSRRSLSDGWRVARQILLISPSQLFIVPGFLLLLLGTGLELRLLRGPILVSTTLTLDFHVMFIGGGMAILGSQLLLLGVYAKTWGLIAEEGVADTWICWLHLRYTLERGLVAGSSVFFAGLFVNVYILVTWIRSGMGGDLFAVRPAVLALTLMVLGAEIVFASFFLSLLRGSRFGRV